MWRAQRVAWLCELLCPCSMKTPTYGVGKSKNGGFTLAEIAIVLVIIGLILGGVLNARSVIRNAQTKDIIKAVNEMSTAAQQFKDRFGMWPGDYNNATASIASLACANGNGNGQVENAAETLCATESLIRSNMLRGTAGSPINVRGNTTLTFTGATQALTGVPTARMPANSTNVLRIQNIDCDIAVQMDRATDDGDVNTGSFKTATACAGQDETIPVVSAVLKIN